MGNFDPRYFKKPTIATDSIEKFFQKIFLFLIANTEKFLMKP